MSTCEDIAEAYGRLRQRTEILEAEAQQHLDSLHGLVQEMRAELSRALRQIRFKGSDYLLHYKTIEDNFRLLPLKVRLLLTRVKKADSLPARPSGGDGGPESDLDQLYDLEDAVEDYARALREMERGCLLGVIDLLDAMQRMAAVEIPQIEQRHGETYFRAFKDLQGKIQWLLGVAQERLAGQFDVTHIPADSFLKQYPPLDITQVIAREDDERHDDIIVTQVVEDAYLWKGKVLRRAAVIVASKEGV